VVASLKGPAYERVARDDDWIWKFHPDFQRDLPILILDGQASVLDANSAFEQLLGYPARDIVREPGLLLFPGDESFRSTTCRDLFEGRIQESISFRRYVSRSGRPQLFKVHTAIFLRGIDGKPVLLRVELHEPRPENWHLLTGMNTPEAYALRQFVLQLCEAISRARANEEQLEDISCELSEAENDRIEKLTVAKGVFSVERVYEYLIRLGLLSDGSSQGLEPT
jgi:PAS domain-containing protein